MSVYRTIGPLVISLFRIVMGLQEINNYIFTRGPQENINEVSFVFFVLKR